MNLVAIRKFLFGLMASDVVMGGFESYIKMLIACAIKAKTKYRVLFVLLQWRSNQVAWERFDIYRFQAVV